MTTKTKPAAKKLSPGPKKAAPKAAPKAEEKPSAGALSASDVAAELGTDPRTLRKFLRASSHYDAVGQGKRYTFAKRDIGPMKKRFAEWRSQTERKAAAKKAEREAKAAAAKGQELDIEIEENELEDA